jgi:hypothetical protein
MKVNLPVVFSQWDDRWGKEWLGFNTKLPYNIYNYGCLLNCLAMICRYYGKDEDPLSLNGKLKDIKGFVSGGNYVWGSITKVYSDIKERLTQTPSPLTDSQFQEIKTALDNGYPVMLEIDYNPKTSQPDMHFVLCCGYNPSNENDLTIADPLGGKLRSLKDYLGWYKPSARKSIERYVIYEGKTPVESAGKVLIDKKELKVLNFVKEQWVKLVAYLEIGTDPNNTLYEDVQRVIGGFKSRVTDLQKQVDFANTEVKNREEQVGRLKNQLLESEKLQKALNIKLNEALKQASGTVGLYEGRIKELQGQVDTLAKEKGSLKTEIANQKTEISNLKTKIENIAKPSMEDASITTLMLVLIKKILHFKRGGESNAE